MKDRWDWLKKQYQKDWLVTSLAISLLALILFGIIAFIWFIILSVNDKFDLHNILTVIGSTAAGILLTINAIYIGRRAAAQDRAAKAQVVANEQGLFNQAIGHLDSKDESVRLGGIYALYSLVEDNSTQEKYLKTVADILCAHVRSKTNGRINNEVNGKPYKEVYTKNPSEEIQSLLNLLTKGDGPGIFKGQRFDFSRTYLQGANFMKAHLQCANFGGAQLQSACFQEAQLQGANFRVAQLQLASFVKAKLHAAYFWGANAFSAGFKNAQLHAARFDGAKLHIAHFESAQFQGAYSTDIGIYDFEGIIDNRAGKPADMSGAIIKGSFTEDEIKQMSKDIGFNLQHIQNELIGNPIYFSSEACLKELKDQGVNLGMYNKDQAKEMIDKYNKALI